MNTSPEVRSDTLAPVVLSARAAEEIKRIIEEKQVPAEYGLRVGVQGGGCAGLSYVLGFDTPREFDDIFEQNGIRLIVDRRHALYLMGTVLDYHDGLNARGFVFHNPNAKSACGCGSSFTT
ncbi:MAG: iron-sulfur cluster assembly accessory protein [Bacteroidetes bacterium]|nr:iron-sulfur cluster assembly accessory protein [Rhodothermia bacterium]MCS7155813.1 iron-sulfur cluster assembly accessory protein [Bacteroidota bacterium]MCX7906086.1 iron-sulfur cluster assembly accessory protein [Bacteroidota bacterium]MDW8138214.1 iron-sulfur cluster assembly accessory protein [Bacteroidota bacterium]MDW8285898.1 iron-sulfur cluster assembly accessory protein [Bacteroidota bacterium]